jgi:hypothetical protein
MFFSGSRDFRDRTADIQQEDQARKAAGFLRDFTAMCCRHGGMRVSPSLGA